MESSMPVQKKRGKNSWFKVFLAGVGLYFLSLVIMVLTGNPNMFPTVAMIGNFLVPIVYVVFFYEHRRLSELGVSTTAYAFLYGGLFGVMAASVLEPIFIRQETHFSVITIGLIEEFVKILGVFLVARRIQHDSEMDGLILGAAVGMGFAALESMGYTFTAFLESGGSLTDTVTTTLLRGILSPVGHGTWTAILASVLFRETRGNRFHFNVKVIGAFLGVALLHALWDGIPHLAALLFSSDQDVVITQVAIGAVGLFFLWLCWRGARRQQNERVHTAEAEAVSQG